MQEYLYLLLFHWFTQGKSSRYAPVFPSGFFSYPVPHAAFHFKEYHKETKNHGLIFQDDIKKKDYLLFNDDKLSVFNSLLICSSLFHSLLSLPTWCLPIQLM